MTIQVGDKQLDLSQRAAIMTIINLTPDSFFEGSRSLDPQVVAARAAKAIAEGADVLDLGAYSSRPGADEVSAAEEIARLSMGIEAVRAFSDVPLSIDTFRAEVVTAIYARFGAFIINDITGGGDREMYATAAKYSLPYVCMHMRGTPKTMQSLTDYHDLVGEVEDYFKTRIEAMQQAGLEQIILDLGFGFAKTTEQNYDLFAAMERFNKFGFAQLVGISRKSMIYKPLDTDAANALTGTCLLNWEALKRGAKILRVHDTLEAAQTVSMFTQFKDFFA